MLEMFRRQLAWSDWANREFLAALRRVEPPSPPGVRRLAHVLAAEHLWLARLERRPQPMAVWPELALAEEPPYTDFIHSVRSAVPESGA